MSVTLTSQEHSLHLVRHIFLISSNSNLRSSCSHQLFIPRQPATWLSCLALHSPVNLKFINP